MRKPRTATSNFLIVASFLFVLLISGAVLGQEYADDEVVIAPVDVLPSCPLGTMEAAVSQFEVGAPYEVTVRVLTAVELTVLGDDFNATPPETAYRFDEGRLMSMGYQRAILFGLEGCAVAVFRGTDDDIRRILREGLGTKT